MTAVSDCRKSASVHLLRENRRVKWRFTIESESFLFESSATRVETVCQQSN